MQRYYKNGKTLDFGPNFAIFAAMKRKLTFILCILTLAALFFVYVQDRTLIFRFKKLEGVYHDPKDARLTLSSFRSGSFQENLEENIRYNFGFREPLIRLYNQYVWDFFRQTTNTTVNVGKDGWLFGWDDVLNYYEGAEYRYTDDNRLMKEKLDLECSRLYKVQHILDEYGVFLFVSLLPSKAFVFPEYLPKHPDPSRADFHAIEYLPLVFDSLGINYINIEKVFENQKGKVDYPLFPKNGMHWSHLAAEHAFDTTLRYIEHANHIKLLHYSFGEKYTDDPKYPDADLEAILNLMRPIKPNVNYYSDIEVINDNTAKKPTFLVIGDSFFWNISGSVPLRQIFRKHQYWYYNSSVHFNSQYTHTSEVDYLKEILNSDIIDLSYSPRQLYIFSDGFLPKALLYLTHEDKEIDSVVNVLAKNIEKESDEENIEAAKDSLFSTPETFFPDLAQENIPTTRNSRIPGILKSRQ